MSASRPTDQPRGFPRWILWAGVLALPALLGAADPTEETLTSQPAAPQTTRPVAISYDKAVILPIDTEITDITYESLKRRCEYARAQRFPLIIIELDTPGGALLPTLKICSLLKEQREDGIAVWAWVNKAAHSAGTIIALAADRIIIARNAQMGDCQPIIVTDKGPSAVPEDIEAKLTSPLMAEMRDSARRNGYPLQMVYALIRPDMQVFWLENEDTGERQFVDTNGRDRLFDLPPVAQAKSSDDDKDEPGQPARVEPVPDSQSNTAWHYVTSAEGLDTVIQPIVGYRHTELLTMSTAEAVAYGFAVARVSSDDELIRFFNVTGPLERQTTTWMEDALQWLSSPMVRGVLLLLMVLAAYSEFHTPGFGVAGATALVALLLFLAPSYLAGYTVEWEILMILAGFALILVELFVMPGFGLAGITGLVLIVVGMIASFVPAEPSYQPEWFRIPTLPLTYDYLRNGLFAVACGMTAAVAGMFLIAKYFRRLPVGSRLISPNPDAAAMALADPYSGSAGVGDVGRAETLLRPAGKARFADRLIDVVSEGEYIQAGQLVEVIEHRGNRVVVRKAP